MTRWLILALAVLLLGATCVEQGVKDVQEFCRQHPEACRTPAVSATPTPPRDPAASPSAEPTPCPEGMHRGGRDGCFYDTPPPPTATHSPSPSPTPEPAVTPAPTEEPTGTALPTPTSAPCYSAFQAGVCPADRPLSIYSRQVREGFEPMDIPGRDGLVANVIRSQCDKDGHGSCPGIGNRPAWAMAYDVNRSGQVVEFVCGAWAIYDGGRGWKDGCARLFHERDGGCKVYEHPEGWTAPWTYNGMALPFVCAPTPTPTLAGPQGGGGAVPTPPPPLAQPKDFRLNFVNGCNRLTHFNEGSRCGICDSTYRFVGTLASGERHGDACDSDHMGNPKTAELCGGRSWDSPRGTEFRIKAEPALGLAGWKVSDDNPYQAEICVWPDTTLTVETCLPAGAQTFDGLPIPGGPGCMAKTFTVH